MKEEPEKTGKNRIQKRRIQKRNTPESDAGRKGENRIQKRSTPGPDAGRKAEKTGEKLIRKEADRADLARGMDTQAMIPVLCVLFEALSLALFPWISVPQLKYSPYSDTSSLLQLSKLWEGLNWQYGISISAASGGWNPLLFRITVLLGVLLSVGFVVAAFGWKYRAVWFGRLVVFAQLIPLVLTSFWSLSVNRQLNDLEGKTNTFWNLTIDSHIQLTAWAYLPVVLAAFLIPFMGNLLDTRREYEARYYQTPSWSEEDSGSKKRTFVGFILIFTAIPAVIFFGIFFLNDRSDYFISLCVILLSMLPFFMVFENRRPQAREVVVIAVMAALAVVGRMAFFMLPHFKPTAAIVIVSGIGLGPEAGFLTGALAGFVSNFFFGQGPWTPWQMFSFGIIGFLAGLLFGGKGRKRRSRLGMCLYGGLSVLVIYGWIMDTATVFMSTGAINKKAFLAAYLSGFPVNVIHGTSTVIFLACLGEPLLKKIDRIRKKYGIIL